MVAHIPVPSAMDVEVAKRLNKDVADVTQADRDEVLRLLMKRRGHVPVACDRDHIPSAPARGPVLLFQPLKTVITGAGNVRTVEDGRFKAMQVQDAFHKAEVHAASRKRPSPFTAGQVAIGREYAYLFERCAGSGLKLSQICGSSGGGGASGVSEAMLSDLRRFERLSRCIGDGTALTVRRVRPSKRGAASGVVARNIRSLDLVRSFCVEGETLSAILTAKGWSDYAGNKKVLHATLCAILERMRAGLVPEI